MNQLMNESMNEWINEWMNEWMNQFLQSNLSLFLYRPIHPCFYTGDPSYRYVSLSLIDGWMFDVQLIDWLIELADWLIGWLVDWLIYLWLIDWLIFNGHWFIYLWLIDWLISTSMYIGYMNCFTVQCPCKLDTGMSSLFNVHVHWMQQ
jgi:hypothetical protein